MIRRSFHPAAYAELEAASLFYESRMVGLGRSFALEVERTVSFIREFPEAGSLVAPACRRVLVPRFPYAVIYRREPDAILVLAVAHLHRRPGYWSARSP